MILIFAQEPIPSSIFLAGPTPRDKATKSWRPEAIQLLSHYDGTVFAPELREYQDKWDYDKQIEWEWKAIATSTVVLFWVPRSDALPAYTTNVEFGLLVATGKVVYGHPPEAPKMKYLDELAMRYNVGVHLSLEDTVKAAILKAQGTTISGVFSK